MAKRIKAAPVTTLIGKPQGKLVHIDPRTLVMNKQVRTTMDEKAGDGLYESVRQMGVQTPIRVREDGGQYHVIAGHRRTTAAIRAELATIPAYVVTAEDDDIRVQQLTENIQREDMTLTDVAAAVWEIYTGQALGSAKQVAALLGKPKSWVSKMLTIGDPELVENNSVVRTLLANDQITDMEIAYLVCRIEKLDKPTAVEVAKNIENETRATVKARLKKLTAAHPEQSEEPSDDEHEPESSDDSGDPAVWSFVQRIVKEATVQPADLTMKQRAMKLIASMLAE